MDKFIVVNSNTIDIAKVISWCDHNMQTTSYSVETNWPSSFWFFKFHNTEDAMLFSLKWA